MEHQLTMRPLDETQFLRWQQLLEERSGLFLPAKRRSFLHAQLSMRMREIGCDDVDEYYNMVNQGTTGTIEWQTLIDRLTVHETRFFRDPDAFALVDQYIQERADSFDNKSFECWSVGCSTGEEVYSLAIIAERHLARRQKRYAITGTDISKEVLHRAKLGVYSARSLDLVPPEFETEMFQIQNHKAQVIERIRQRCCFTQVNILKLADYPLHSQQIIFCQNVLIYFRRWRRREILNILAQRLAPGGLLVIGSGDLVDFQHPLLEPVANTKVSAFIRTTNHNMESARL